MKRMSLVAASLALALAALTSTAVLAHGGKEVVVKPLSAAPGEKIDVKGAGLGNNQQIEIRVVGQGADVDLGEIKSADDGDFEGSFTLPKTLAPGIYEVRAIGAETATTSLTITAAAAPAGGQAASPAVNPAAPAGASAAPAPPAAAGAMPAQAAETVRERPFGESLVLVALFGLLAGLGLFLARSARPAPAPSAAGAGKDGVDSPTPASAG